MYTMRDGSKLDVGATGEFLASLPGDVDYSLVAESVVGDPSVGVVHRVSTRWFGTDGCMYETMVFEDSADSPRPARSQRVRGKNGTPGDWEREAHENHIRIVGELLGHQVTLLLVDR